MQVLGVSCFFLGFSDAWYHLRGGLVESPLRWPGLHAARHLVHGEPLEGVWFNRSKEWAARIRHQEYGTYDFATRYSIRLAQLPAFRHLTPEEYQDKVAGLIREIEDESERKRDGDPVAGVEKILSQNPLEPPTRQTKRSPKPLFHFATREERDDLEDGFMAFLGQYRISSEAFRGGNLKAAALDREARCRFRRAGRDAGGRDCAGGRGTSSRPAALRSSMAPRRSRSGRCQASATA